jgi:competence ComEA-like helix-hairpin-helix protein
MHQVLVFLRAVSPQFAVISCSQKNRYGHPAVETLHRLQNRSIQTWVTANQGTLVGHTDGHSWKWEKKWGSTYSTTQLKSPLDPPSLKHTPPPSLRSVLSSPTTIPSTQAIPSAQNLISINTATSEQLQSLPRIGPKLAQRILNYRKANGAFQTIADLVRVRGIGKKTLARFCPLIKV